MRKIYYQLATISSLALALVAVSWGLKNSNAPTRLAGLLNEQTAAAAATVVGDFFYTFNEPGILEESWPTTESSSPYWWLNSGGLFYLEGGLGRTIQGELASTNRWRLAYALTSARDTEKGYHPQNLFRLVTRSQWLEFSQQLNFQINEYRQSASPNRNGSNGVFLMIRYQDGNNLYYAGLRVDGAAVIKKKLNGIYYTLDYQPLFASGNLPLGTWLALKAEVQNLANGAVEVKLYLDETLKGEWRLVARAVDDGRQNGGAAIRRQGYAGIRTDFMDVIFDDYRAIELTGLSASGEN